MLSQDERIAKLLAIRSKAHGTGAGVGCHLSEPLLHPLNLHFVKEVFREISRLAQDLLENEGYQE